MRMRCRLTATGDLQLRIGGERIAGMDLPDADAIRSGLGLFATGQSDLVPDGTPVLGYYQGETYALPMPVVRHEDGAAFDLAGVSIEVVLSAYLARVHVDSERVTMDAFEAQAAIAARTIAVDVTDAPAGLAEWIVPSDLYTPAVGLSLTEDVPVLRCMVRYTSRVVGGTPEVLMDPFGVIVRPGP